MSYQDDIIDNINDIVLFLDDNYNIIDINRYGLDFFNKNKEEIIGKKCYQLLHGVKADISNCPLQNITDKKSKLYEIKIDKYILVKKIPISSEKNRSLKFACIIKDETDNYLIDKKLKISEEKYKAAFYTSPNAININKLDGKYLEINEGFTLLTGFTEDDVIGKFSSEIDIWSVPEDRKKLIKGLKKNGIVENLESIFRAKNGELIPALMSAKLIDISGEICILSVTREIKDRKKIEEKLLKAKNKAEESDRLKTEFLKNISHEVRTPMNGIIGFSEILKDPDIDRETMEYYIEIIQHSADQLLKIIEDILEISKIETGQISKNMEYFSLNNLLKELYFIFKLKAEKNGIDIDLNIGLTDKKSEIYSDKTKVTKILSCLIDNGIKFTPKGGVKIGSYIEKDKIVIYVKDSGVGISFEKKDKIFDLFSQGDKGLSKKFGGLGLGLSISKNSAEVLGGEIKVKSEKDKGSTFYLYLPYENSEI